jgi:hypothetical protein
MIDAGLRGVQGVKGILKWYKISHLFLLSDVAASENWLLLSSSHAQTISTSHLASTI